MVTIRPLKIVRSTKKAFMIEWFDYGYLRKVKAWVPRSIITIERETGYINTYIYNNLKRIL